MASCLHGPSAERASQYSIKVESLKQFETLRFTADAKGQSDKNSVLTYLTQRGWQITSETIEQGHFKGDEACCLALICLPLGFAAGRTPNVAVVNIQRDASHPEQTVHEHVWYMFDYNRVFCKTCELVVPSTDWKRYGGVLA